MVLAALCCPQALQNPLFTVGLRRGCRCLQRWLAGRHWPISGLEFAANRHALEICVREALGYIEERQLQAFACRRNLDLFCRRELCS